jgi:hypothetical protein
MDKVKITLSISKSIIDELPELKTQMGLNNSEVFEAGIIAVKKSLSSEEKLKDLNRKLEDNIEQSRKLKEEIEHTEKILKTRGKFEEVEDNIFKSRITYWAKKLSLGYDKHVMSLCKEWAHKDKKPADELFAMCLELSKTIKVTDDDEEQIDRSMKNC